MRARPIVKAPPLRLSKPAATTSRLSRIQAGLARSGGRGALMDSFELNKFAGAILGVLLFAMAIHLLSGVIYSPKKPAISGYDLAAPAEEAAAGAGATPQAQAEPLRVLLAKADPGKGQ